MRGRSGLHLGFLLFCAALGLFATGCAAGSSETQSGALGTGGSTASGGGKGGSGGQGGQGGQGGGPLTGQLDVCVLNAGGPTDACQKPPHLDFGNVQGGSQTMRLFRVDNDTNAEAEIDKTQIASDQFKVATVRYEDDPGNPGHLIRVPQSLPEKRSPGESLWFEVTWTATGAAGPIPADQALVSAKVKSSPVPDLVVPMVGASDGCPAGTDACDSDPTNGCETHIDNDPKNCGACGHACNPAHATASCTNGHCGIQACDAGYGDCDMNPQNGCETNLLNTATACGTCTNNCNKNHTNAFCNGGSCNIIGCEMGYADCNLMAADGCETNVLGSDNANCGGCNIACTLPHAGAQCIGGACTLGACAPGYQDCDQDPSTGCETNTDGDAQHCGSCNHVCNFQNASGSCSAGACVLGACDANYANCDGNDANGCEAALQTDKNNCGGCGNRCDALYAHSNTSCGNGACSWVSCLPGYYDIDHNLANGCEYQCAFQSPTDLPDDGFVDANCDGIDGDVSAAIFVAKNGSDTNPGTPELPMLTINAGIGKAQATGKTEVYVSQGTYQERVTLVNGISIYGGYSQANGWARGPSYTVVIQSGTVANGRVSAVEGISINAPTTLDRLTIQTLDTTAAGISNYAMICNGCTALTLKNSTLEAGSGGNGTKGADGTDGANGSGGNPGGGGTCDGNQSGAPGGSGGTSACGRTGGGGGKGG
ncbi:MAG TPA: hypothetical protein VHB21_15570, partial [Minicystis sp.]|nr:hypothetical protein [Minicystis sp.]